MRKLCKENQIKLLGKCLSDKLSSTYFWLVSQTVQSRQLRQLGEAAVIDTEVQVLVQDTEILIAALHNPTTTLQIDKSFHLLGIYEEDHKASQHGSWLQ